MVGGRGGEEEIQDEAGGERATKEERIVTFQQPVAVKFTGE